MAVLEAILLGILQGILEFLPVSSFGHLTILEKLLGFSSGSGVLFEVFLHIGTLAAVLLVFWRDVRAILREVPALLLAGLANVRIYLANRRRNIPLPYRKAVTGSSSKLTFLLLLSSAATFLIGFSAKNLVYLSRTTEFMAPIGILMTGVFLLVTDLGAPAKGRRGIAEATCDHALWLGIAQGISVFPGISRLGISLSLMHLFGYKISFAVRYVFLMSIPAILGALCAELPHITGLSGEQIGACICGMLAAGITAYFMIRMLLRLLSRVRLRVFAFYCFILGTGILLNEYLF